MTPYDPDKVRAVLRKSGQAYERDPRTGLLVQSHKVLIPRGRAVPQPKPQPKHVNLKGQSTDVSKRHMEEIYDVAKNHYELKAGHSLDAKPRELKKIRDLCDRAGEQTVR